MPYRSLKSIHHQYDAARADDAHRARFNSEAAIHWDFPVGDHTLFCVLAPHVVGLIERVWARELAVADVWSALPGAAKGHMIRALLTDEIISTNAIEGVHSTKQEVEAALEPGPASGEGRRFRELARLFLSLSDGPVEPPKTLDGIRALYDDTLGDEISGDDALDGNRFRAGPVSVIGANQRELHRGFTPESAIDDGLRAMLDAENNPETPMLIRAVISHFMFESVHPFYDGNGRMGRLLLGIHLSNLLSAPTALRLSRLVAEEKARYYKAFSETEHPLNRGDATHFVATMLELVSETQSELHGDLSQRIEALEHLKSRAPKHGDAAPGCGEGALQALYLLAQVDLFGSPNGIRLDEVAAYVEKNVRTARKYLQELQDHGLATTTSERPLRFTLTRKGRAAAFGDDAPAGMASENR